MHIRADSTGSISSLGSFTGGASTISMGGGKTFVNQLTNDIKSFLGNSPRNQEQKYVFGHQKNIINDEQEFLNFDNGRSRGSSGFLSSILGGKGGSSVGSGYQSLEEDTEDFHVKNQAFLRKAGRNRSQREQALWGGERSPINGVDALYVKFHMIA